MSLPHTQIHKHTLARYYHSKSQQLGDTIFTGDVSMDTEETAGDYWAQFMLLVSLLRELGTLTFFLKHSVVEVVRREVSGCSLFP